ncbi:MAG: phosphotransferase [Solirubrobacteraceae bacterium]|nr:phosphotransferase [Solirubrobacteraceae bacterium]
MSRSAPVVDVRDIDAGALGRSLVAAGIASGALRALRSLPAGEWPGGMSELVRLALDWDGDGPETLVAKQAARGDRTRATAGFMRMYEREVAFYEQLAPRSPLAAPDCHHAAFDGESRRFLLLLADRRADRALDELAGCSIDDARTVVAAMGGLHAEFHDAPPALGDALLPALGTQWYATCWSQLLAATWEPAATIHADLTDSGTRALGDALIAGTEPVLARLSRGPRTLCHGDLRADNLLLGADGVLRAVDWQLMHRSRGVCDLGYFMAVSLELDVRRRHHDELVELYVDAYGRVDRATLLDELRDAAAAAFMIPVIASAALDLQDARGVAVCRTTYRRAAAFADDLDCVARLAAG